MSSYAGTTAFWAISSRVVTGLDCVFSSAICSVNSNIIPHLVSSILASLPILSEPSLTIEHARTVAVSGGVIPSLFMCVTGNTLKKLALILYIYSLSQLTLWRSHHVFLLGDLFSSVYNHHSSFGPTVTDAVLAKRSTPWAIRLSYQHQNLYFCPDTGLICRKTMNSHFFLNWELVGAHESSLIITVSEGRSLYFLVASGKFSWLFRALGLDMYMVAGQPVL